MSRKRLSLLLGMTAVLALVSGYPRLQASASPIVLVGSTVAAPQMDSNSAGSAQAYGYTAVASGTVASLSLDVVSGPGTVQLGLYNDASGGPGSLLTAGTLTNPASGWKTVPVPAASVTSGTRYWLVILDVSGTVTYLDNNGPGSSAPMSASTNLATLPPTWASGAAWPAGPASIYASTSASATPTPATTATPTPSPTATPSPPPNVAFDDEFIGSC